MREPSYEDSLRVLLLQAADEGRGEVLFGDSLNRVGNEAAPFMVGEDFPSVYLECPLVGDPFIDITLLYAKLAPGTHVEHPAAEGSNAMLEWFAETCAGQPEVCCGFELDVKEPELPAAAVHFQPRKNTELVRPFCETIGEPERAELYLNLAARMPEGWPLSFFGLFRGRPGSPLRVCGYLNSDEQKICADNPQHLADVFDEIGFTAYDNAMVQEISAFFAIAPGVTDFQLDVYPDGSLSNTFAIDIQFEIEQPEAVQESFENGAASRIMHLFEKKGITDDRWKLVPEATFARALPMKRDDGSLGKFGFTLMPQWTKVRWRDGVLQPAKMYYLANATFLQGSRSDEPENQSGA